MVAGFVNITLTGEMKHYNKKLKCNFLLMKPHLSYLEIGK
jgi:hypothetical protein